MSSEMNSEMNSKFTFVIMSELIPKIALPSLHTNRWWRDLYMCNTVHIRRYYNLFDERESGSSQMLNPIEKYWDNLIGIDRHWSFLIGIGINSTILISIDRYWSAFGIDRGSPEFRCNPDHDSCWVTYLGLESANFMSSHFVKSDVLVPSVS